MLGTHVLIQKPALLERAVALHACKCSLRKVHRFNVLRIEQKSNIEGQTNEEQVTLNIRDSSRSILKTYLHHVALLPKCRVAHCAHEVPLLHVNGLDMLLQLRRAAELAFTVFIVACKRSLLLMHCVSKIIIVYSPVRYTSNACRRIMKRTRSINAYLKNYASSYHEAEKSNIHSARTHTGGFRDAPPSCVYIGKHKKRNSFTDCVSTEECQNRKTCITNRQQPMGHQSGCLTYRPSEPRCPKTRPQVSHSNDAF